MATYSQQKFDGLSIDRREGRFTGAFDVEEEDADEILMDAYVLCVTVVKCGPATVKPMKNGDRVRSDTFKVQDARLVIDEDLREILVDKLDLTWPEKLALEEPDKPAPKPKRQADVVTGEIDAPEEEPEPEPEAKPKRQRAKPKAKDEDEAEEEPADDDNWEMPPPPRSGVVGDAARPAPAERINPADVFSPGADPSADRELVGVIKSSGPGDPLLDKFLQEPG